MSPNGSFLSQSYAGKGSNKSSSLQQGMPVFTCDWGELYSRGIKHIVRLFIYFSWNCVWRCLSLWYEFLFKPLEVVKMLVQCWCSHRPSAWSPGGINSVLLLLHMFHTHVSGQMHTSCWKIEYAQGNVVHCKVPYKIWTSLKIYIFFFMHVFTLYRLVW